MDFFPTLTLPGLLRTGAFIVVVLVWLGFIGVPWSHIGRISLFCLIFIALLIKCCPL